MSLRGIATENVKSKIGRIINWRARRFSAIMGPFKDFFGEKTMAARMQNGVFFHQKKDFYLMFYFVKFNFD